MAGINGTQALLPELLLKMAGEYCRAYECGWKLDEFYEVKKLLDKIRICLIPILNPDGYEIRQNGFGAIRNPVYRQMLRMQSIPAEDFGYNARGMDISHNFPTVHYIRSRMGEEPASENETKALIRIIQNMMEEDFDVCSIRKGNHLLSLSAGSGKSSEILPAGKTYAEIFFLSSGKGTDDRIGQGKI